MAVPEFSFSSEENAWHSSENLVRFSELLLRKPTVDLCGSSPYWTNPVRSHGTEEDGLETFTRSDQLVGESVFANPPYGKLPAQEITYRDLSEYNRRFLPKGLTFDEGEQLLSAPLPKRLLGSDDLTKLPDGRYSYINPKTEKEELVYSNVHSAHTFALYLLYLWESAVIKQAVVIIPSATDSKGWAKMFSSARFVINTTNRLPFELHRDGEIKKVSGNTKGSSIFWLPPHGSIETEQDILDKLHFVTDAMGGDVGFRYTISKCVDIREAGPISI